METKAGYFLVKCRLCGSEWFYPDVYKDVIILPFECSHCRIKRVYIRRDT